MSKTQKPTLAVGIDFGGTAVKIGLVDSTGHVREQHAVETASIIAQPVWLDVMTARVRQFQKDHGPILGVGVGVPGFTDFKRGFIFRLTNVPGWKSVHLAEALRRRLKMPAFVDNDVNAMAVGECAFGAGRAYRHAVLATLGTGVGGGVVIDGRLYRGAFSMAGEIGHIPIYKDGLISPEGRGGLELYVGNRRIVEYTLARLKTAPPSLIQTLAEAQNAPITPKIIAAAARQGDQLALEIFDYVADCLATAFAGITYVLQPEVFIVGGGVAQSGRVLFTPLRRHLKQRLSPFFAARVRVIPASLGEQAGMIGCAALVFQNAHE